MKVNIAKAIIDRAFKEGWHDTLYYYVRLKKQFHKPIFYNYSYRKIANLINASPSSVSKHVKILIDKNLAHISNGHLCIYSPQNSLLKNNIKDNTIVNIPYHASKRAMLDELRGVILIQNLNCQKKAIARSSAIVKKCNRPDSIVSKREYKYITKKGGLEVLEKNINNNVSLSNKSIGVLFNRSQSTGKLYQKRLNKQGVISSKANIKVLLVGVVSKMCIDLKKGQYVNRDNNLIQQSSNLIFSKNTLSNEDIYWSIHSGNPSGGVPNIK